MFLHVIVRSSPCCECLSVSEVYLAIQWIIKVFYVERGKIRLSFHQDITGAYFLGIGKVVRTRKIREINKILIILIPWVLQ